MGIVMKKSYLLGAATALAVILQIQVASAQGAGPAGGGQTAQQQLTESAQNELDRLQREIDAESKEIGNLKEELEGEKANLNHFERVKNKKVSHFVEDKNTKEKTPVTETLTPEEIQDGVTPDSGIEATKKAIDELNQKIREKEKSRAENTERRQKIVEKANTKSPGGTEQAGGPGGGQGQKNCRRGEADLARYEEYRKRLRLIEREIEERDDLERNLSLDEQLTRSAEINPVTQQARLDELKLRREDNQKHLKNLRISAENLRDLIKQILDFFCPPPPVALPFPQGGATPQPEKTEARTPAATTETKSVDRTPRRSPEKTVSTRKTQTQSINRQSKTEERPQQSAAGSAAGQAVGTAIGLGIGIGLGHAMNREHHREHRMEHTGGMRMR